MGYLTTNDDFELKGGDSPPQVETKHCKFALYEDDEASTPGGSDATSVRKRQDLIEDDENIAKSRTVYVDGGLMSPEELMHANGGRRRTLERLMAGDLIDIESDLFFDRYKEKARYLLDKSRISITVSYLVRFTTLRIFVHISFICMPPH